MADYSLTSRPLIISTDAGTLASKLYKISAVVRSRIKRAYEHSGRVMVNEIKARLMSGRPGVRAMTGELRRSVYSKVRGGVKGLTLDIGATSIYASTHIFGMVISPATRQYMAFEPNWDSVIPSRASKGPGLVVIRGGAGGLVLIDSRTKELRYILRQTVYIPPRIPEPAWKRVVEEVVQTDFVPTVETIVKQEMNR